MSERERVILDLVRRLKAVGIHPDGPFSATWDGAEWTFSNEAGSAALETGGARAEKVREGFVPQKR